MAKSMRTRKTQAKKQSRSPQATRLLGKVPMTRRNVLLTMATVIIVGVAAIYYTHAATGPVSVESAAGTLAGNAALVSNSAEAGGQLVRFGGSSNTPTPTPSSSGGTVLSVNGVSLVRGGTRFIFKGVNLEYFRDSGNASISNSEVPIASQIVAKMKAIGINAVRLDYSPSFVNQGSNMTNYLAMMKLLANNGIYVMPCDHSYTGKDISGYTTTSFPDFKTIVDYAAQQGITDYLIMNPYNEPYSSDNASSWNAANEATLQYFRNTLSFKGVVVLDTTAWATTDNTSSFQTLMSYDASLLGGKSNVIFSNHLYPNYNYQTPVTLSKTYPLTFGEIGNTLSGSYSSSGAGYVNTVFQSLISTGIPNGHNGAFPWIWWWTDGNQMTNDGLNLNSFGQSIVTNFYNKVN